MISLRGPLSLLLTGVLACSTADPTPAVASDTERELREMARRQDGMDRRLADLDARIGMLAGKVDRALPQAPPALDVVNLPPTHPSDEEAERDELEAGAAEDGSEPVVLRLHEDERPGPRRGNPGRATSAVAESYERARALFQAGDYERAATAFEEIARQDPQHDLADNAVFWRGACFQGSGQYARAIEQLQQVVVQYPRSDKVPDALLRIARCYRSLNDQVSARVYLAQVVEQFPASTAAREARVLLAEGATAP
ncbi:MAG: tol-pal system protein YbgF [Pseudomonadota bacterium]